MKIINYKLIITSLIILFFPFISLAAVSTDTGLVPCTGINCSLCDFFGLAQNIFNFVVWTIVPILGTIMILWSGFVLMMARGNQTEVGKGKKMITATLIGIAIVYSSYIMASFVVRLISGENSVASYSFKNGMFEVSCGGGNIRDVTRDFVKDGRFTVEVGEEILVIEEEPAPVINSISEASNEELIGDIDIKAKSDVIFSGIKTNVLQALGSAVSDVRNNSATLTLKDLLVASAFRSLEEQEDLVERNCVDPNSGKCIPKPGRNLTCIPRDTDKNGSIDGRNCRHTTGNALDVWGYGADGKKCCQEEVIRVMKANGFCVYNKEYWHFELKKNLESEPSRMGVFTCG